MPARFGSFCRDSKYDLVEHFHWLADLEETVWFLKAFFSWRCDRWRGKKGHNSPGIKYKSSLETFWKWWHLVYKAEIGQGLSKDTTVKILDVSNWDMTSLLVKARLTIYRCWQSLQKRKSFSTDATQKPWCTLRMWLSSLAYFYPPQRWLLNVVGFAYKCSCTASWQLSQEAALGLYWTYAIGTSY